MKWRLNLCITALVVAGLFWAVQGYFERINPAPTSRPEWLWIGAACVAVGGLMLLMLNWPEKRP